LDAAGLRLDGRELSLAGPRRAELALERLAAVRGVVDRRPRSLGCARSFVSMDPFWGELRGVVFFF
jgi:hypothetical protein